MSEKETNQKVVTKYDKKMQKRKEQQEKEKKSKKKTTVIAAVIAALCLVGVGAVFFTRYQAVNGTYVTINDEKISKVEFDYYYHVVINNYQHMYGAYMGYMGLDITADLYAQAFSEDMSWGDYFEEMAIDYMKETKALVNDAKANGFTYDVAAEYAEFEKSFAEAAAEANVSTGSYCKSMYGDYATMSRIKPMIEESILYSAYYNEKRDSIQPTDQEILDYYNENKEAYDYVDYRIFTMAAEYEKPAEGETVSDEVVEAAMKEAKAKADEFVAKVEAGEAFNDVCKEYAAEDDTSYEDENASLIEAKAKSKISTQYSDWLFEEGRKAGDVTYVEDTVNDRYYIVSFEKRYLDEALSANVRFIFTSSTDGETIVQEWKGGAATEDSFVELVEKYSEGDKTNGGLVENVTSGSVLADIQTWLFEEERKAGDVTAIAAANGNNYVLYYSGDGEPQWKVFASNAMISQKMTEYVENLKETYTVTDVKGNIKYLELLNAKPQEDVSGQ